MTTVHISLGRDDGTDKTAAKGVVEWEPTTRREDGTMVILERGFTVPLVAGEATVVVDPSGLTWCWRVTERTDSGGTVRYVSVPDSAVVVEYVDLPDVDPTTLVAWSPADPEAAYLARLAAVKVEDLADVDTTDLEDGFTLVWDAASSTWQVGASGAAATGDFAPASHAHAQSDITGLTDALAGKAATSHNHAASEITSGTVATARLGSGTPSAATFLRGDQTWAAPSGGALIVPNTFPDSIYALGGGPVTSTGLALSADKVYLTPYRLFSGAKVRRLVLIVITAPSQAITVECGIWNSAAQKVISATLSISTTGTKVIDLGSVQSLAPDTYWLCTKVLGTNAYGLVLGREYQPEAVITPRGNAWDAPDGSRRGLSGASSGTGAIASDLSGLTLAMEPASIGYGYRVA